MPASASDARQREGRNDLLARARAGEGQAFEELITPYRRELEVHCYRMLGSVTDAEDALQESLAAAWQGIGAFRGAASIRTWLYRVTTTRCLNFLRSATRRQPRDTFTLDVEPPQPTRLGEIVWLEPYPNRWLDEIPDDSAGPEAQYERREAVSLAFVSALQLLPPQQRAVLVLRDALGFSARESASILQTTEHSVNSGLLRARATLSRELPDSEKTSATPESPEQAEVLARLVAAWESCDVRALVELMTDDVWVRMPPRPLEYQGHDLAASWFSTIVFRTGRQFRLVPTGANGQPAFGVYLRREGTDIATGTGIVVVALSRDRVSAITHFQGWQLGRFGLASTTPIP